MSKEPTKKLVCIKDVLLGKRESLINISILGAGPQLTNQSRHHPKKKAIPMDNGVRKQKQRTA